MDTKKTHRVKALEGLDKNALRCREQIIEVKSLKTASVGTFAS